MKRFEKHHIEALKLVLEESKHSTKEKKIELAGLDRVEPITSWLSQKNTRKRAKELIAARLVQAHGQLQQALRLSQESAAELQYELQESKRREARLQAEYQLLKQRLTVAQGVRQF